MFLTILVLSLFHDAQSAVALNGRIAALTAAPAGRVNCATTDAQDILFIVNNHYGVTCVEVNNVWEMQLAECLVIRGDTTFTIVSGEELSRLAMMSEVNTIPAATITGDLSGLCTWAQANLDVAAVAPATKTVRQAVTLTERPKDTLLAKYSKGVYDVVVEENVAANAVTVLRYTAANIQAAAEAVAPNNGITPIDCNAAHGRYLVHGMELHECGDDNRLSFVGCVLNIPQQHGLQQTVGDNFVVPYIDVSEDDNLEESLRMLKIYNSFAEFRSNVPPLVANPTTHAQLCASISALPDAYDEIDQHFTLPANSRSFHSTVANDREIYFYPRHRFPDRRN